MSQSDGDTERRNKLRWALLDIRAHGPKSRDEAVSWPLALVDAVLRSESAGDAARQDELIEAIGVVLGLGVDERLTPSGAADRLSGEGARGFILATLHAEQEKAEAALLTAEVECDEGQIGTNFGKIEALAYAMELVNLSVLPTDNDQQLGELLTIGDAKALEGFMGGEPETEEVRLVLRRIHKLAKRADQ